MAGRDTLFFTYRLNDFLTLEVWGCSDAASKFKSVPFDPQCLYVVPFNPFRLYQYKWEGTEMTLYPLFPSKILEDSRHTLLPLMFYMYICVS